MITREQIAKRQKELYDSATALVESKGHDYNRAQQASGDSLFNMRVSKLLGITDTVTQGVLTRLSDKFMRLISLTKDPSVIAKVKDESILDTARDIFNYVSYLTLFFEEERNEAISEAEKNKIDYYIPKEK